MYKKETLKSSSTGATPSTWSFFDILDVMWCKTPRCRGLVGGLDNDVPAKENEDILNELEQEVRTNSGVSASTSQNLISSMDFSELEGVSGSKAKQSKQSQRSLLGVVNRTMGEGMNKLCDTLRDVEDKHNATLRELEASRHALEESLLRIHEEEDTKRQQIYLSTQLEPTKILAKVRD
ncbi:hypothetical protein GOP47_0028622 [Adiantum capillus-veneris]|nr:hypothetical protein GOP47_0028622 [Adiantum capillus-veneris]